MIREFYDYLLRCYGEPRWWPSRSGSRWEIAAGAVLTQNCAWRNVELALDNLERLELVTPSAVLAAPEETLQSAIRPAGYYRGKSATLRTLARFWLEREAAYLAPCSDDELLRRRHALLALRGIGRETADAILLYAFGHPQFVIDAYTRRIAERHLGIPDAAKLPYDRLQELFTAQLPRSVPLYGQYHALLVEFAKDSCRKPRCGAACAGWPPA